MKNKLRILLGNNTLALLAGSETWTMTLARELKRRGHIVECFSPELGIIADALRKDGIECFADVSTFGVKPFSFVLDRPHQFEYDLIIANHWHIVDYLRKQFPKTPIISTIHGILHTATDGKTKKEVWAPEHPATESGVQQFVAVSEEVQQMLMDKYKIDSMIVRNFFDIKQFKVKRALSGTPKVFFINTNYAGRGDAEIEVIREVAKHYDAKLVAVGQNFSQTPDVRTAINDSDVVIGMGRSVLEGVAAGRMGIVHGRWGTGGVIHESTVAELRACNFSGRNSNGVMWTKEEFIAAIDQFYNPKVLEWGKSYVAREHNVELAAETLIQFARTLVGTDISQPVETDRRIPFRLSGE